MLNLISPARNLQIIMKRVSARQLASEVVHGYLFHMTHLKLVKNVIPMDIRDRRREALVSGIGQVLAKNGFKAASPDCVADVSGVPRKFIYKDFGGMEGLVKAYATDGRFWPAASDLVRGDEEALRKLTPGELMAEFFRRYLAAILERPQTLDIMAWESLERNELCGPLEDSRVRTALEFFELMESDPPEDVDLTALVLVMAGAVHFLTVRSRTNRFLGGVDLRSEDGWKRVEATIEQILKSVLG